MKTYNAKTDRFGVLLLEAEDIHEARRMAKSRFGVNAKDVSPYRSYRTCDRCESSPCCCLRRSA